MGPSEYRPGYYLPPGHQEAGKRNDSELLKGFSPNKSVDVTMDELMNGPIEVRMAVLRWQQNYEPLKERGNENPYSILEVLLAEYPQELDRPSRPLYWDN